MLTVRNGSYGYVDTTPDKLGTNVVPEPQVSSDGREQVSSSYFQMNNSSTKYKKTHTHREKI
jgi:hypothetical protein